jgi:outer membrane protein TolC
MYKPVFILAVLACLGRAEDHPMTFRQVVELALKQNPDVVLARLDEQKARQGVRVAKGPFTPKLTVGSGLAYTNGFPMSIEGSAPSIVQAAATMNIFNRRNSLLIAQAKEDARGAGYAAANKRDDAAYRAASLYLDAERGMRLADLARKEIDSRQSVADTVHTQVAEGRALPITEKQAALAVAQAKQEVLGLEDDRDAAETSLAVILGYPAEDRVRPVSEDRAAPALPATPDEAIQAALDSNKELRQLESQIASKQIEMRAEKASKWPRADLVAQYGLFAKFNNFSQYFNAFQRNNGEIGASFQLPVLVGGAVGAEVAQSEIDLSHIKLELSNARNRIAADLQEAMRQTTRTQSAAEVARLDLDLAREQVSVDLAQMQEGRLSVRVMEEARIAENSKWIALYDAQYSLEKARWNVLRLTGQMMAAVEKLPAAGRVIN